jgi:hypothetical protein
VLVPPTVQAMPRVGKVTVRKGKDFTLRCAAKGNPNPTISWSKEVSCSSKPQKPSSHDQRANVVRFVISIFSKTIVKNKYSRF